MAGSGRVANALNSLAKLDSSLQRGLDNALAFVFRGRLVPAELEELLKQEAEDNVVHTEDGYVEAPNVFKVSVSPNDFSNLLEKYPRLAGGFADQMTRFCRNSGWSLAGPVVVLIAEDAGRHTGQLKSVSEKDPDPELNSGFLPLEGDGVVAVTESESKKMSDYSGTEFLPTQSAQRPLAQGVPPAQVDSARQSSVVHSGPTVTLLLQDGSSRTYVVQEGSNIIGRSNDADFRLPDTGVSRQHCEITWDGRDAILVDLKSTNGTTVNDTPVENWLLADGDVINVGHSNIEVRITNQRG
jgi:FOG: FHA domain